jgi:hypothetical protein
MTLREQFEPHLLSPHGAHLNAELCRKAWDEVQDEAHLNEEFERAVEWLSLIGKTKNINRRAGHSYGLKHAVEGYFHRKHGQGDVYVSNGVFLMAARHLGFKLEPYEARYAGGDWDCWNAFLNISSKRPEDARRG